MTERYWIEYKMTVATVMVTEKPWLWFGSEQFKILLDGLMIALREESNQTNVILQYKLLAAILSAVCSVIQQS